MSEVITRPKSGKTKAVSAVPAAQQTASTSTVREGTQRPEWLALALPHARKLSDFLYVMAGCAEEQKAPGLIQGNVQEADGILSDLRSDESMLLYEDSDANPMWSKVNTVLLLLRSAAYACQHGPLSYASVIHCSIIDAAISYATGLYEALSAIPEDLSLLKALDGDVYLRMKPDERIQARLQEQEAAQAMRVAAQPPGDTFHANDIDLVFSTLTSQCLVLRDFIINARVDLENEGGSSRAISNFSVAEHLACLVGSLADQMCMARTIGGPADWVTGVSISRKEGSA